MMVDLATRVGARWNDEHAPLRRLAEMQRGAASP
jgi:hypothetical protein